MKKKLIFIINPKAGIKPKKNTTDYIYKHIDNNKFDCDIRFTECAGHATQIAADAVKSGAEVVVGFGGDGTIREIAKGIVGSDVILGIIPGGSGNGFADHFRIPQRWSSAIKIINKMKVISVDTGTINDELFIHAAGIGFDAIVSQKFADNMIRGLFSYIKTALIEYVQFNPLNYTLIFDGNEIKRRAFLIAFANVSEYGNRFTISPEASVTDGLIDVVIGNPFFFTAVPGLIYRSLRRTLHHSKYIEIFRVKEVKVMREFRNPVHFDGDTRRMDTELNIVIHPASLKLIVPDDKKRY